MSCVWFIWGDQGGLTEVPGDSLNSYVILGEQVVLSVAHLHREVAWKAHDKCMHSLESGSKSNCVRE